MIVVVELRTLVEDCEAVFIVKGSLLVLAYSILQGLSNGIVLISPRSFVDSLDAFVCMLNISSLVTWSIRRFTPYSVRTLV